MHSRLKAEQGCSHAGGFEPSARVRIVPGPEATFCLRGVTVCSHLLRFVGVEEFRDERPPECSGQPDANKFAKHAVTNVGEAAWKGQVDDAGPLDGRAGTYIKVVGTGVGQERSRLTSRCLLLRAQNWRSARTRRVKQALLARLNKGEFETPAQQGAQA